MREFELGRGRRLLAVAGVAAVLAVLATACGGGSGKSATTSTTTPTGQPVAMELVNEGTPVQGGKLVVGVTSETDTFSPLTGQWTDAGHLVASSVYEPLFVYNANKDLVPWLAESYTANADNTQFKIELRQGVTFHDGTEMNGQTMTTVLAVALTEGITAVAYGDLFKGVEATGPYEITVTTSQPWATAMNVLAAGQLGLAYSPAMLDMPDKGGRDPIGTGAFKFDSWTPDASFKVSAYDNYWGGPCAVDDPGDLVTEFCGEIGVPMGQKNGPFLDAMEFRPIPDQLQRINALQSGDVNMIEMAEASGVADLRSDYTVVTDYNSEKRFVQVNTKAAPLDNQHARNALAYATNSAQVRDVVAEGEPLTIDTSPFSANSKWGGFDTQAKTYDPAQAQQEVEAYKADTGQSSLSVTILGLSTNEDLQIMQLLQDQWSQVGIETKVDAREQLAFITQMVGGTSELALTRNYAYPDPDSEAFFWEARTTQPPLVINFSQYSSDVTEQAIKEGRSTTDFNQRHDAYARMAQDRNNEVTELWLYDTPYSIAADTSVHGLNWARVLSWGNFLPKPYITGLWIES